MIGIGEAIVCEIVAQTLFKSLKIAKAILDDGRNFTDDRNRYQIRFRCEIARLEGVQKILEDQRIATHIPERDKHTYYHIVREMNRDLIEYAIKTKVCTQTEIDANKADHLFECLQDSAPALLNPPKAQVSFWVRATEKVVWALYKKQNIEKLVVSIEQWGNLFNVLMSTMVPQICVENRYSTDEIAEITPHPNAQLDVSAACNLLIEHQNAETELNDDKVELTVVNCPKDELLILDTSQVILEFKGPVGVMIDGDENDPLRTSLGGRNRRCWATYSGETVIVEFKSHHLGLQDTDRRNIKQLNSLVRELRTASKTEAFHVFYCHGYYEDNETYGIVYKLPPTFDARTDECQSLANILLKKEYRDHLRQNLQYRIDLAKALATTLYHLHSVQWVHKSINPDNILLFGKKTENDIVEFEWNRPYLVGFDGSRLSRAETEGLSPCLRWQNRVYIDPEYQGEFRQTHERFRKIFDLYSLGVILLEIGLMRCFKASAYRRNQDGEWNSLSSAALKEKFIECAKDLSGVLGSLYANLVLACLTGGFGIKPEREDPDEARLLEAFRSEVCEKLDQIRI